MKARILILSFFTFAGFFTQAQSTRSAAQTSIDSLLPSASAVQMLKVRQAFTKALTYAENLANERIKHVSNVAALKALTNNTNGQIVTTRGYYSNADGGGNTYYFNSSSTATDNGGFVIAPSSGTGRWIATNQTVADVLQFGAKGDATTNDLNAFDRAGAASLKGRLNIPNRVFKISGTWSISKNAQNDTSQSNYIISAVGAKIITDNAPSIPVLRVYNSKRLEIQGIEVQGTTAFEGLWYGNISQGKFKLVTFGKSDTDAFDEHYWNDFRTCQFEGIEIYCGNNADLQEFNANSFYQCLFRDVPYLIKLYGSESIQNTSFYNCDFSNVGTKILYINEIIKNGQLDFYSCYFDDWDENQGFPVDLKGVEINFFGNSLAANISTTFDVKAASFVNQNFSVGTVGNRISSRTATSSLNLIKNGDLKYGGAGIVVNLALTKEIVADTGYYNRALKVSGNSAQESYFESIPVPFDGIYSLIVIGKNTGGKTLVPFYTIYSNDTTQLYTPIGLPTNRYTVSGCSVRLKKGAKFRLSFYTQAISGNEFFISYVGLTFGKQGNLGVLMHPLAEEAVTAASTTFNPPSIPTLSTATTTVDLPGAVVGDYIIPSHSSTLLGVQMNAYVSAPDVVTVTYFNPTASAVDIGSGTLKVKRIF